jgi:hypothetical protein
MAPPMETAAPAVSSPNLPPLIPSPLLATSLQDSSLAPSSPFFTSATARPAPSSTHTRCSSIADFRGDALCNDAAAGQRQLPTVCYAASAIGSVICFCAAAIILMRTSKFATNAFGNATSSQAEAGAELSKNCNSFYGAFEPKISVFLLFVSSLILAAAARSNVIACPSPRPFFLFFVLESFFLTAPPQ